MSPARLDSHSAELGATTVALLICERNRFVRKMLAGLAVAGALTLGSGAVAHAAPAQDTETADESENGEVGLLGLLGLAGLAGLAGLKRRDRTDNRRDAGRGQNR